MKDTFSRIVSVLAFLLAATALVISAWPDDGPDGTVTEIVTGDAVRPVIEGDRLLRWMVSQEDADDALQVHLQSRYKFVTGLITHLNAGIAAAHPSYTPLDCPKDCDGAGPPQGGCKIRPDCD